jgi:hypothetical protein
MTFEAVSALAMKSSRATAIATKRRYLQRPMGEVVTVLDPMVSKTAIAVAQLLFPETSDLKWLFPQEKANFRCTSKGD